MVSLELFDNISILVGGTDPTEPLSLGSDLFKLLMTLVSLTGDFLGHGGENGVGDFAGEREPSKGVGVFGDIDVIAGCLEGFGFSLVNGTGFGAGEPLL